MFQLRPKCSSAIWESGPRLPNAKQPQTEPELDPLPSCVITNNHNRLYLILHRPAGSFVHTDTLAVDTGVVVAGLYQGKRN